MPSPSLEQDTGVRKDEEPNMEHFAKAAENLVASLDDDDDEEVILWFCVCEHCKLQNVVQLLLEQCD